MALAAVLLTTAATSCLSLTGLSGGQIDADAGHPPDANHADRMELDVTSDHAVKSDVVAADVPHITCKDGGTDCDGSCIDTTTSPENCGGCGLACEGMCTTSYCLSELDNANTGQIIAGLAFTGSMVFFAGQSVSQNTFAGGPVKDYSETVFEILPQEPYAVATDTVTVFIGGVGFIDAFATGSATMAALDVGAIGSAGGMAVDATNLYWTDPGMQTVLEMPKGGGIVITLATGQANATGIAVDPTHVYWIANGGVESAPIESAGVTSVPPPVVLASTTTNTAGPTPIAVQAGTVYWADYQNGQILSIAAGGGTASTIATSQPNPTALTADSKAVYWTNNVAGGNLVKQELSGGASVTMVTGLPQPTALTLGYSEVFVAVIIADDGYMLKISPK
jgi:hypothetical protein